MVWIVGIGEYAVTDNENDTIKAFALGSCVAITVYSPQKKAAGMAHIALPSFESANVVDDTKLCYYATTAVPFLINKMCSEYGCLKDELKIELFGGANSARTNDLFKIGQRNIETVKRILTNLGLKYCARETGGVYSRSIQMDVATGRITVISHPIII